MYIIIIYYIPRNGGTRARVYPRASYDEIQKKTSFYYFFQYIFNETNVSAVLLKIYKILCTLEKLGVVDGIVHAVRSWPTYKNKNRRFFFVQSLIEKEREKSRCKKKRETIWLTPLPLRAYNGWVKNKYIYIYINRKPSNTYTTWVYDNNIINNKK